MDVLIRKLMLSCLALGLVTANVGFAFADGEKVPTVVKPAKGPKAAVTAPAETAPATTAPTPKTPVTPPATPSTTTAPVKSGVIERRRYSMDPNYSTATLLTDTGGFFYLQSGDPVIRSQIDTYLGTGKHVYLTGVEIYRGTTPFFQAMTFSLTPPKGLKAPQQTPPPPKPVKPAPVEPKLPPLPRPPSGTTTKDTTGSLPTLPKPPKPGTVEPTVVKGESGAKTKKGQDFAALQGEWQGWQRYSYYDEETREWVKVKKEAPVFVKFENEQITINTPRYDVAGTFAIDELKDPKDMDLLKFDVTMKSGESFHYDEAFAIYQLTGNSLNICMGIDHAVRPLSFDECDSGHGTFVYVSRKQEKQDKTSQTAAPKATATTATNGATNTSGWGDTKTK